MGLILIWGKESFMLRSEDEESEHDFAIQDSAQSLFHEYHVSGAVSHRGAQGASGSIMVNASASAQVGESTEVDDSALAQNAGAQEANGSMVVSTSASAQVGVSTEMNDSAIAQNKFRIIAHQANSNMANHGSEAAEAESIHERPTIATSTHSSGVVIPVSGTHELCPTTGPYKGFGCHSHGCPCKWFESCDVGSTRMGQCIWPFWLSFLLVAIFFCLAPLTLVACVSSRKRCARYW